MTGKGPDRMKLGNLVRSSILILGILSLVLLPLQSVEGDARPTIRIGVLNHTTYADQDANGEWQGLDIECMINVAQRAGFQVEFVDSLLEPDFLGELDRGTYDIVADVVRTPEREQHYLFTDESIGYTSSTLAVRSDDERWDYGNSEQVANMRIGVIASYANNRAFRHWCETHGVVPEVIEYSDISQMTAALLAGNIDGEVYTAVYEQERDDRLRTIMRFLPQSFYYAFRRDDMALKNRVDRALAEIIAGNPDYLTNLKSKYEEQYEVNVLPFSVAERQYIAAHPILTVAVIDHDEPYYMKGTDGADAGIIPDYYALAAEGTGFQFRYTVYGNMEEAAAAVKEGKADLLGLFSNGLVASQHYGLALTDAYFEVNRVLLVRMDQDPATMKRIAIRKGMPDSLLAKLRSDFSSAELVVYSSAQQSFDAVRDGDSEAVLLGLPSATWQLNQTNTNAYRILPMPGAAFELCGAVNNDNPLLCSILNKRIAATKDSFSGIVARNTMPKGDWHTTLLRIPPVFLLLIVVILLALVVGLIWALVMLRARQRERSAILTAQADTERQKLKVEAMQKNAEERNAFFANISHDMRTPLNAIMNFIGLAEKDGLSVEQRSQYLQKASSSSQLMLDLIDDTLTVSKLSSGKLVLHPKPCQLRQLFEAVAAPIKEAADRKNLTFQVDFQKLPDTVVRADHLSVEKIFLNLLSNAVRYTPEGGHIWYTAEQVSADAGQAAYVITVRDDGIGIRESFMPKLFEPFAQEKRQGYESVGTGLGLSIVRRLVSLMDGTITVDSILGKGTTFVVRLCFEPAVEEEPVNRAAEILPGAPDLQGKNVLLCEDNELNREIAIALLSDKGMTVVSAEDGRQGLTLFEDSAPGAFDAILMDIRMPVMDGIEATRAIRALSRPDAQTIPIIAMTADAFADDIQRCLDAGMRAHLAKPINPSLMFEVLRQQIHRSS